MPRQICQNRVKKFYPNIIFAKRKWYFNKIFWQYTCGLVSLETEREKLIRERKEEREKWRSETERENKCLSLE